ncbi:MAG: DUF1801 domain-containing protein [Candidatus Dojkabacteria bacterium]
MAELKTKATTVSVADFINSIEDEIKKNDCKEILKMMAEVTGDKGKMWGSSIVGFVDVHLKYESGRELDWFKIGFSPRKQNLTLYGLLNNLGDSSNLLDKLGKYTTSKGCLYIKKLSEVNKDILKEIIKKALTV